MKGKVTVHKQIVIPSFETVRMKEKTRIRGHSKKVHVVTKPSVRLFSENILTQAMYLKLKPGSSKVTMSLHNITAMENKILVRTVIGQIQAIQTIQKILT